MIRTALRGMWKPLLMATGLAVLLSGCHYYHHRHHGYYAPNPYYAPKPYYRPYHRPHGYYY